MLRAPGGLPLRSGLHDRRQAEAPLLPPPPPDAGLGSEQLAKMHFYAALVRTDAATLKLLTRAELLALLE